MTNCAVTFKVMCLHNQKINRVGTYINIVWKLNEIEFILSRPLMEDILVQLKFLQDSFVWVEQDVKKNKTAEFIG